MSVTPPRSIQAYCEISLPSSGNQQQNELLLLQALLDRGIFAHDQFFLYQNGREIRIVGDPCAKITVEEEAVSLWLRSTEQTRHEEIRLDPFKQVERLLMDVPVSSPTAYGYVAFDMMRHYFEYGTAKALVSPLLCFIVPSIEIHLTAHGIYLRSLDEHVIQDITHAWEYATQCAVPPAPHPTTLEISMEDRTWYEQSVRALTEAIRSDASYGGPFQKAILSRAVNVPGPLDLLGTYALVQGDPSARSYCFRLGTNAAVGSSPEILLKADAAGSIRTHPLAGTRWRGNTSQEDAELRNQLHTSRKQQIEHLISVVAAQREMEAVCQDETVFIHGLAHVQQYRTVQHLASRLYGRLAPNKSVWDALRAVFPGVTVSGISKASAISWIDRLEQVSRGLYAGAIGWINSDGSADLAIAIRTIFQRDSLVSFYAGAGIVADSDPADEYEETWHKMQAMWPYFVRSKSR